MRSNPCILRQNAADLGEIFTTVDQYAAHNAFSRKRWLQLRLLAEELTGMLPALLQWSSGTFWLENEDNHYELHISLKASFENSFQREQLLALSTSGKNAAAVGIMGKIRCAIEGAALAKSAQSGSRWTLKGYRSEAQREQSSWNELKRSIIANLADDVIVAISGEKVEITVIKTFWLE